jgi:hypothetical protein
VSAISVVPFRRELAADFRRGSARLMESVPLFDRAVSHLMQGLRRSPNGPH